MATPRKASGHIPDANEAKLTWGAVAGNAAHHGGHRGLRPKSKLVDVKNKGGNEHNPENPRDVGHKMTWGAAAGHVAAETTQKIVL